jgi:type I restriction enzyme, S subunit
MIDLPRGWALSKIDQITDINPRHPRTLNNALPVTFVRMPSLSETSWRFESTQERSLGEVRKGFTHFAEGDVLFAKITPCMENGKAAVALNLTNGLGCGTTELHVMRPLGGVDPKYLFYFIHQESFREEAARNFTGTAGQLRVPTSFIKEAELPLPPCNEQRRIVAKLETLLSRVNAAQERLANLPRSLKRFRQSVLAAACCGELTADWRRQTKVAEMTEIERIEDVASYLGGFAYKSSSFTEDGTNQVIRIGNVRPLTLRLDASPVFIPDEIAEASCRFRLQQDDLVISMTGTKYKKDYGYAALVPETEKKLYLNQRVSRLRCGLKILPRFLLYWLQTDLFREFFFEGETGNVNQGNIGADGIRKAPIKLPPLLEQEEIVRCVEELFKTADALEARYLKAKAHVDKLTQSILVKAFRGELVPQDPNDEPASVLLDRIIGERNGPAVVKRRSRK